MSSVFSSTYCHIDGVSILLFPLRAPLRLKVAIFRVVNIVWLAVLAELASPGVSRGAGGSADLLVLSAFWKKISCDALCGGDGSFWNLCPW